MTTVLRFPPLSALSLLLALSGCAAIDSGDAGADVEAETGVVASALVIPAAPACSAAKTAEALSTIDGKTAVALDCSLTLPDSTKTIKKRIVLSGPVASGVTLDCHGSSIQAPADGVAVAITSKKNADATWSRPESITIKNCIVDGNISLGGMDLAAQQVSSFTSGHTARAQAAAPKNINLSNLTVTAKNNGTALFVGTGVTYVSLTDSELLGTSPNRSAIDLDNESGHHTIRNNYIHVDGGGVRQQISVDSSSYNKILGNIIGDTTIGLTHGGIYLYRNCGERGVVRQQSPSYNDIIGNVFLYASSFSFLDGSWRPTPAVWIGSRNTRTANGEIGYCNDDKDAMVALGLPLLGSAASDSDYAHENVVAENKIYGRDPAQMVRDDDTSNDLFSNVKVSTSVPMASVVPPSLGCALRLPAGRTVYLKHNTTFAARTDLLVGDVYQCNEGALTVTKGVALEKKTFACAKASDNAGCSATLACPAGKRLVGLQATCNLEQATLTSAQLAGTLQDTMRVGQASDVVSDGACTVGTQTLSSGSADVTAQLGRAASLPIACKEHDVNLGDCVIQGEALCL
jgi:hypothetical protein